MVPRVEADVSCLHCDLSSKISGYEYTCILCRSRGTYIVTPRVIIGRNVEHIQEQSKQYAREVGRDHAGVAWS